MSKTYEATIKLQGGSLQKVRVDADSTFNARKMLEAQYGKGSVVMSPSEVRKR